jgi:hypothetical protein
MTKSECSALLPESGFWISTATENGTAATWTGSSSREVENDGKPVNESFEVRWERRVGLLAGVFFVYSFGALAGGILQTRFASLGCGIATDRHRACGG